MDESIPTTSSSDTAVVETGGHGDDADAVVQVPSVTGAAGALSKRQRRRLEKKLKWESHKHEKRLKERLRKKQRVAEALKQNLPLGPSRKQLKQSTMVNSPCKIRVVIDMNFDELMSNRDLNKVIKQTLRSYSLNRRSATPLQLHVTSFTGLIAQEMTKHVGYNNWDVHFSEHTYLDTFSGRRGDIVYLTSESDNVVERLRDDCVYVIGGLVDHNQHKGLCHKLAVENSVRHAQLPIGEYVRMSSRKVLTIDQVFEILLRVAEGRTWQQAFLQVIPERKGARSITS